MNTTQIEQKAEAYTNQQVPNPHKHNAPYYTTLDKWEDIYEAYTAGYQQALSDIGEGEKKIVLLTHSAEPEGYDVNGDPIYRLLSVSETTQRQLANLKREAEELRQRVKDLEAGAGNAD